MDMSSSKMLKVGAAVLAGVVTTQAGQAFVASPAPGALRATSSQAVGQQPTQQSAETFMPSMSACGAVGLLAAASALASGAKPGSRSLPSRIVCKSGKMSPGYNTLPEWEKPLNGLEGNLGEQEPLGLWDPAGFTKDGDVEKFVRRRETEFKHGRVAMFATIGYIVPEYVRLPGELSPSSGLRFTDVPNGLGALSKVPAAGWAQIIAFIGLIETQYNKKYAEPGNYGKGFLGLGSIGVNANIQDPEKRNKKLNADLANGRLAMMAIIGMFFQDGLTGSAWGDWSLYTASPLR